MHELPALFTGVTAILALALLGARLAAGARAALRHLILATAFGAVLMLPFASQVSPRVTIEIATLPARSAQPVAAQPRNAATAPTTSSAASSAPSSVVRGGTQPARTPLVSDTRHAPPSSTRLPSGTWLLLAWAVVALLALVPVITGLWRLRGIRKDGHAWPEGQATVDQLAQSAGARRPIVLLHQGIAAPISGGVLHPVVVLPAAASTWSDAHLTGALLHELEHVRRHDWAIHLATRTVCALYWFHPLAWMAWRRLRLEAERACDDAALAREDAVVYAAQLLQLARHLAGKPALPGLQMIGNSSLAARIRSVLDTRQQRGRAGTTALTCVLVAAVVVVAILASLRATGPKPDAVVEAATSLAASAPATAPGPQGRDAPTDTGSLVLPTDAPVGFSAVRNTGGEDPHAYGPKVELCLVNGRWTGFFAEYIGPPADPPTGKLENLLLDEGSGTLSFAVQLTTGMESSAGGEIPALRRYEFSGRLDGNAMAGRLVKKPLGASRFQPTDEDIVFQRQSVEAAAATSCAKWSDSWNRRTADRQASPAYQAPAMSNRSAASPQAVVGDVLDLVQSALADPSAASLDELTWPITGLHHLQRHAQAVVHDDGERPAELADNYIEIINALTNTANMAANIGRRPRDPQPPPPAFAELSAALRTRADALTALLMPVAASGPTAIPTATAEQRAARAVFDLVQATYRDPRFVGPIGGSWLRTELDTLARAAQSFLGGTDAPAAAAMNLHLLSSSIRSTTRQATDIAGRPDHPAETRRKATDLAVALRDIESRLDAQAQPASRTPAQDVDETGWLVTLRSIGPLAIGMPIGEVRQIIGDPSAFLVQALHQERALPREPDDAGCGYLVTARVPEQIGLMFRKGRLARADVWHPGIRATSGTQVGDTEAQVREQHGSVIKVTSHRHASAGAHYMTFTPSAKADREYQMLFETDGRLVTQFRTGLRTAVQRTEGCE